MCNIWKKGITNRESSARDFADCFSMPEFKELEDLNISGGEPFLRKDVLELVEKIIDKLPRLRMLFVSTNGTKPRKAKEFVQRFSNRIEDLHVCVSIEGNKETNRLIRGIDSYDSALETIRLCKGVNDQVHTIISTTLTPINANIQSLQHIKKIAEETDSTYSFRIAWTNTTYYQNLEGKLVIPQKSFNEIIQFMEKHCMEDPFMRNQLEYFKTGNVPIMGDMKSHIKCRAGDLFVLVKPDCTIYPCINSSRMIGNLKQGIYMKDIKDLGEFEQCPCCTECCVWPMITFSNTDNNVTRGRGS